MGEISRTVAADGKEYSLVFVPQNLTPLSEYAALYMAAGYSYKAVCSLLNGLSQSSLYAHTKLPQSGKEKK